MFKKLLKTLYVLCFIVIIANFLGCSTYTYRNANKYTIGAGSVNANDVIALDIDWISGNVNTEYYDGEEVVFGESSQTELAEEQLMRYWLDNGTLRIRFVKNGFSDYENLEKNLTIKIPQNKVLDKIEADLVSSNLSINSVLAKKINIETVSGNVNFNNIIENAEVETNINLETTSGMISGNIKNKVETFSVESVFNFINLTFDNLNKIDIENVSGSVKLNIKNSDFSGGEIETVSGHITLNFEEKPQLDVVFNSVSGEFNTDFACTISGSHYKFDGSEKLKVETVSGNLSILESQR